MRAVVRKTNEGLLFAAPDDTVQAVPFEDGRVVDLTIDDGRLIVTAEAAPSGDERPGASADAKGSRAIEPERRSGGLYAGMTEAEIREEKIRRVKALQERLARYPRTGLVADKAFYDSLSDEDD